MEPDVFVPATALIESFICRKSASKYIVIQGVFFNVPPNFQNQNEKRWAAKQRFCSMKFSMYKRPSLVEQRFYF